MNIVFGMCGNGTRFNTQYPGIPKYMITYHGKTMIEHAVTTLNIPGKLHFIVRRDHLLNNLSIEPLLKKLGGNIIISDNYQPIGAANTLLEAKLFINPDEPLLSVNCDQHLDWSTTPIQFVELAKHNPTISYIFTFQSDNPNYSYIKTNRLGKVVEVKEKQIIGPSACAGMYHWAKANDFFNDSEQMIKDQQQVNGEFYVAPVYNYTIAKGLVVNEFKLKQGELCPVGTPNELQEFLQNGHVQCIK